ncbi:CRISPR-associated helicase Cas3' [Lactobacillus sp. ESL0703]|uniref:CRISPR-associated helicase Cas3' n=1 Tax=Lactobacillus sp. ESL0703 TaxID=2983218 RepID=UPI0023F8FFF4|nr:CRISPR-associated helicase Cas3' [Lactobacillus sp. ESL0703]MDF7668684.1 CRISPR-associated helicase Cas3' [Lactobacillus sp. ESL0703]
MPALSKKTLALWAKKNTENGQQRWLPLIAHLTDTKKVINFLYNHWLSNNQRQFLKGNLSDDEIHKLIKFLGFIHDVGKATPAFQTKESYANDKNLDSELIEKLIRQGFSGLDDLQLPLQKESPHNRAGEALLLKFGVPENVAALIGGHHGKPEADAPYNEIGNQKANYYQSDQNKALQRPWQQVQKELFDYGLATAGYESATDIPNITQPQAVILEGLIIMADWLASSEHTNNGEDLFPLISLDQTWYDLNMEERFEKAMHNWYLSEEWEPQKVSEATDPYEKRWGFEARPVQRTITKAIGETTDPGMVIVEAPMGLGKTEIALVAVEQLAYITGADGLFMGLPTQATSNAMFSRVEHWLQKLSDEQKGDFSIDLMHSRKAFDDEYKKLPDAENVVDDTDKGAITVNSWFSGKKSILTKFTIGTIDNLLSMGLKQKHLFLKHLGLSGKVVVIDEVHAYDAYMSQYLYKAIRWLGTYHVPIVILSATLPTEKRKLLIQSYLIGKYGWQFALKFKAPADWENNQAYPLVSILDGCQLKQISEFPGQSDQKTQKLQVSRINLPDEELVADILDKIKAGGVAGVIVNTVKRAQSLAKLVAQEDVELMVLHSAFLAPERTKQETKLQDAIGKIDKKSKRPEKLVVIGTQVLEQSLDIDFDVLYTDIAPIDLILQRAGRLHRHEIARPKGLEQPQLYVMGINDFGDYGPANESIYHKYLLMKTDHFLPEQITLPDDISNLVQQVYNPKTDSEINGIEKAKKEFNLYIEKEEQKASDFQIDDPDPEESIHGWLNYDQLDVDKDEQKASASVRDIQETIEVILIKHTTKGNFLINGQNLAQVSDYDISEQIIRLPTAITQYANEIEAVIKRLEELTNEYCADWQNSVWLKGALALPLDENLTTTLGKWTLQYSEQFGLSYTKDDDDD